MSILFNPLNKVFSWISGQAGKVLTPEDKRINDLASGMHDGVHAGQPIQDKAIIWFLPAKKADKPSRNDRFLKRFQKRLQVEKHIRQREELRESLKELQCACEARDWLYEQLSRQKERLDQILMEREALLIALDDFPKYMRNLQEEHDVNAELAILKASVAFVEERKARADENVAAARAHLQARQGAKMV